MQLALLEGGAVLGHSSSRRLDVCAYADLLHGDPGRSGPFYRANSGSCISHPLNGGFMRSSVKGCAPGYAVACAVYSCVEQKATSRLMTSRWKRYVAGLQRSAQNLQHLREA